MLVTTLLSAHPKKIEQCEISCDMVKAIIMQETRNRNLIGDTHLKNDYSVGYAQVRISTARWMLRYKVHTKGLVGNALRYLVFKKKLKLSKLLRIKFINVYFARNYLEFICNRKKGNFRSTIIAYNTGPSASRDVIRRHGNRYFQEYMVHYKKIIKQ